MAYEVHNGSLFTQGIWTPGAGIGGSGALHHEITTTGMQHRQQQQQQQQQGCLNETIFARGNSLNAGAMQYGNGTANSNNTTMNLAGGFANNLELSNSNRSQHLMRHAHAHHPLHHMLNNMDPIMQMPNVYRPQIRPSCSLGAETMSSPSSELISGVGILTWLSSKAGLITAKANKFTVSFQLKDFCDQGVSDLTAVLRPGFTLSFQAISSESNDWIATHVSPLHSFEADKEFFGASEVDLEAAAASQTSGPPRLAKDMYSIELELRAIPMLLSIFQRHALPHCQLSSLHSQISNCGDEELYRYVGTSSLKRRQYLERRTHLFIMTSADQVYLQAGGIYQAVVLLARYLLRRGGVTSTQSLFDYFTSCPEIIIEAREMIGDGRAAFLSLITSHPWIFALFPARNFVSVRRNLPHYDYCAFLNQNFPDCELIMSRHISSQPPPQSAPPASAPHHAAHHSVQAPQSVKLLPASAHISNSSSSSAQLRTATPLMLPPPINAAASSITTANNQQQSLATTTQMVVVASRSALNNARVQMVAAGAPPGPPSAATGAAWPPAISALSGSTAGIGTLEPNAKTNENAAVVWSSLAQAVRNAGAAAAVTAPTTTAHQSTTSHSSFWSNNSNNNNNTNATTTVANATSNSNNNRQQQFNCTNISNSANNNTGGVMRQSCSPQLSGISSNSSQTSSVCGLFMQQQQQQQVINKLMVSSVATQTDENFCVSSSILKNPPAPPVPDRKSQPQMVDTSCGPDDDMKTRCCCACGGALMGGGVSPSKNATMMMMGVDREQIGSNRVAVQNRSDNHEDEDEEVHERLYNPFHSFDLTTTAHQFSALNL